jgi:hypothetical protein
LEEWLWNVRRDGIERLREEGKGELRRREWESRVERNGKAYIFMASNCSFFGITSSM